MTNIEISLGNATLQICLSSGFALLVYLFFISESWKLRHIPTAGFSGWPVLSIVSIIQLILNGDNLLLECHHRYKKPFKIASLNEWIVILHDGVEDIRDTMSLSSSVASAAEFLDRIFHLGHSIGKIALDHQHTKVIIQRFTRDAASNILELRNEAEAAMNDIIMSDSENEWEGYDLEHLCEQVVGRVTARMIVGETLCKNQRFLHICNQFTTQVFKTAMFMNLMVPPILWPISRYFLKGTKPSIDIMREFVEPIIKESPYWNESENSEQMSPTPLDWLISLAKGHEDEYTIDGLTKRVLFLVFSSLSTTGMQFRISLYNLASHPEYIPLLREDVTNILLEDGWSKSSFDKMVKLESFIQESHRTTPASRIMSPRVMLKDHTLRDGTPIPQGTVIAHWTEGMNTDDRVFENAQKFDGLRFYDMFRNGQKVGLTNLNPRFVLFGIGRQACPGRFFASLEMKLLLAYVLLNFDIKTLPLQNNMKRRKLTIFNTTPAQGQILLRRREKSD
ncbi:cytochrome P450 [Cyathus striatus]|nr:cytochrome P450 [Cyathus striatus]